MEKQEKNELLDEKLMFIWDNIPILSYFKTVRKINKEKINMGEYDLYQMLAENNKLEDTNYYESYKKTMENLSISNQELIKKCFDSTFKEREQIINISFPKLTNYTKHMNNLALNKANELLYNDTEKGLVLLYKNGYIYNKDTLKVLDYLTDVSDDKTKFLISLYLLNLKKVIKNRKEKNYTVTLLKRLNNN